MKAAEGDDTPFAAWDVAYFEEQLARTRYGVDGNTVCRYFPLDGFGPGGAREPDALVESFLGRPMTPDAFYRALGLSP